MFVSQSCSKLYKNLNFDIIYSSCKFPDEFWSRHGLAVAFPIIIGACLFLIAVIGHLFLKKLHPELLQSKRIPSPFERAINLCLSSLYTFIISFAMAPFRCFAQADGSFTLVPSPDLDCFDNQWIRNWPLICLGLLYILVIPIYFVCILYFYKPKQMSNAFYFRFGFLVLGYSGGSNYFERRYWW
jgi:hypothetical protein